MRCLSGHELPPDAERECPVCGEPARALVTAERRVGVKRLLPGLLLIASPFGFVFVLSSFVELERPWSLILSLFLSFVVLGGVLQTAGSIHAMARASARVRKRIRRSTEPISLALFGCPQCGTQNQGPFQRAIPECSECGTKVIGAVCWRCGNEAVHRAFEGEEALTEYTCGSCGELQALPRPATAAWWR